MQAQLGADSPVASYWLLITRDVLPGIRNKSYGDQKKIVSAHAMLTSLPYELPKALEVAAATLTHHVRNGERLYSKSNGLWTFTRCQELILYGSNEYPAVVGGFESSGLAVSHDFFDHAGSGVSGCRKFF